MWPFVVFLGWPLLEIALFVVIGGQIGLLATLAWVLGTAVFGGVILNVIARRKALALRDMRDPARVMAAGAMGLLGGVLLILPGFFTDALGILLLLPPVQTLVARVFSARVQALWPKRPMGDEVIDAEYTEVPPKRDQPSGWTRID